MKSVLSLPLIINRTRIANRIVLAPMGLGHCRHGVPDDTLRAFYRNRAEHGVGMLLTGATFIDHPAASNHPLLPSVTGEDAQDSWGRIVSDVHAAGVPIILQLEHAGTDRDLGFSLDSSADVLSPSGIDHNGRPYGRAMDRDDIREVIEAFGRSAQIADMLGFDGVEIHGAHGFLIDQFLWNVTNKRCDEYGEPSRFAVDVVQETRKCTRCDFIVGFRWSQWKMHNHRAVIVRSPMELESILVPISDAGVDFLDVSTRRWWEPLFPDSSLTGAAWTKRLLGKPTVAVGCVGTRGSSFHTVFDGVGARSCSLSGVEKAITSEDFDLVGVGRPLLGDPAWAEKAVSRNFDQMRDFDARTLAVLR